MIGTKFVEKSVAARRKGIIHFIVYLIFQVVLKSGGVYFVLLVIGSFLLDYKTMQNVGIGESIRESATSAFIFGLVLASINFVGTEILYRKRK